MTRRGSTGASRRAGRGRALWLISGLLVASGAVRFTAGVGPALARGVGESQAETLPAAAPTGCEPPEDIMTVLEALKGRQQALDQREAALADRMAALHLAETEVQKNIEALKAAESSLSATVSVAETASENDLARLTSVYENMKPKDAAALFQEMAPDFAAGFLGRMRPDAAAAIMAGLKPQSAYTISVVLAGRNANAPTQ